MNVIVRSLCRLRVTSFTVTRRVVGVLTYICICTVEAMWKDNNPYSTNFADVYRKYQINGEMNPYPRNIFAISSQL